MPPLGIHASLCHVVLVSLLFSVHSVSMTESMHRADHGFSLHVPFSQTGGLTDDQSHEPLSLMFAFKLANMWPADVRTYQTAPLKYCLWARRDPSVVKNT